LLAQSDKQTTGYCTAASYVIQEQPFQLICAHEHVLLTTADRRSKDFCCSSFVVLLRGLAY